jgi:archaellum component FlaC
MKLNHPLCKEAFFIIPEKTKIYTTKELYDIICDLKNNFKDMTNKINNQEDIIKKQQNDIKELKERIIKLEKI